MSKEVTQLAYSLLGPEFPIAERRVSFYLSVQEGHLPQGRFVSCFQGDQEGGPRICLAWPVLGPNSSVFKEFINPVGFTVINA